jgi:hypothetical protein
MIIWSYKLERFDLLANSGQSAVEKSLNQFGEEGWEFVGVEDVGGHPYALFKRPVDLGEAAD